MLSKAVVKYVILALIHCSIKAMLQLSHFGRQEAMLKWTYLVDGNLPAGPLLCQCKLGIVLYVTRVIEAVSEIVSCFLFPQMES